MTAQMPLFPAPSAPPIVFRSIDDEDGEICGLCEIELHESNRSGTEENPLCNACNQRLFFMIEWFRRGGTPAALDELKTEGPVFLSGKMYKSARPQ